MSSGRFVDSNGYVRVRVAPGDWRYEHRVVWERLNGPIATGFHVHHKNGNREDNRPENLELHHIVDHNRAHTTQRHRDGRLNNRGDRSGRWRRELNDDEIIQRRHAGESFRSIGRDLGASHNVIAVHYRRALEMA